MGIIGQKIGFGLCYDNDLNLFEEIVGGNFFWKLFLDICLGYS